LRSLAGHFREAPRAIRGHRGRVPVPSAEQNALVRRVSIAGALMDVLVVLTIYFMVVHQ
jgi:hypothetical protein